MPKWGGMISSIHIDSFRGIRSGLLEGLGRLAVLVGPSGCGKSTLLEALLIGSSPSPGDAVGRAVLRRSELPRGARWLFWRGGREEKAARLRVMQGEHPERAVELKLSSELSTRLEEQMLAQRKPGPYLQVSLHATRGPEVLDARTAFCATNEFLFEQEGSSLLREGPRVRLVDARPGTRHASLAQVYSYAVEEGRLPAVIGLVQELVPELTDIRLLADDDSTVVHLAFEDHSVPVALAGDGIHSLIRLAFELAAVRGGTALMEEPEAHQHPRAVLQSARAIVAAARRGVQVVLTTHSLELIDALVSELREEELGLLSVHHLKQVAGTLKVSRHAGPEVAFARQEIGEDLR
jgi:predicted ATPase